MRYERNPTGPRNGPSKIWASGPNANWKKLSPDKLATSRKRNTGAFKKPEHKPANTSSSNPASTSVKEKVLPKQAEELKANPKLEGKQETEKQEPQKQPEVNSCTHQDKPKISQSEAAWLMDQLPKDARTGLPKIATDAAKGIVRLNPTADLDDLLSHATEAVMRASRSMDSADDVKGFENKAKAAIRNALADQGRAKKRKKRGEDKVKQTGEEGFDNTPGRGEESFGDRPSSEKVAEVIKSLPSAIDQDIAVLKMMGESLEGIAKKLGIRKDEVFKRLKAMAKYFPESKTYEEKESEGKDRYASFPVRPEVWEEILKQSKSYPTPGEFVRYVMEAMNYTQGQWEAINKGRVAYLTSGSQRYEKEDNHKFSTTQFNIEDGEVRDILRSMSDSISEDDLSEEGRENEPHITIKYGLHTDDAKEVKDAVKGHGPVKVTLGKTKIFPAKEDDSQRGGESQDVVYVSVKSNGLEDLNKVISDSCEHTDSHPKYVPHVCLAYVKPGKGKKYVDMMDADGKEMTFDKVVFSSLTKEKTDIPLGDTKSKNAPRHQPPKRIEGAVARLEALCEYNEEIPEDDLEKEVRDIAKEFDAADLKDVARKFGVKRGLATKMMALEKILAKVCGDGEKGNRLKGGVGDKANMQLEEGIRVEMEHTDDPEIAREIAMDHLTEDPNYYSKLRLVESK